MNDNQTDYSRHVPRFVHVLPANVGQSKRVFVVLIGWGAEVAGLILEPCEHTWFASTPFPGLAAPCVRYISPHVCTTVLMMRIVDPKHNKSSKRGLDSLNSGCAWFTDLEPSLSRGRRGDDLYTAAAALGLGTSLFFIHIYVTSLKRFVQVGPCSF